MVKYLSWYASKQAHRKVTFKTDIRQAAQRFKEKNPNQPPILIFDFIATIPILFTDQNEAKCAGRQGECIRRAEEILQKFKDAGIELAFFLDGPIKPMKYPEWIRRANLDYEEHKGIYANLKANEFIRYKFQKYLKTYYENYLRVAKKFGKVFVSIQNECDLDLAEYTSRYRTLAVFSSDSDFLIMPGDWPVWIPATFNADQFTVMAWNKRHLRESLGLYPWQMPIFATLSGNDWIEYKHVEHIHKAVKGETTLDEVAQLVRDEFKDSRDTVVNLVQLIYNHGKCELPRNELIRLVRMSLDFYNYKNHKVTQIEPDWLRDHIIKTSDFLILSISQKRVLHIPQPYLDISKKDVSPFCDLVLPLLRREIGIFYHREKGNKDFKYEICLKPSENEPFQISEFTPLYPDFEVPPMDDILEDDEDIVSLEKRLELLAWIVASKRRKPKVELMLKLLKTIFIVPSLIANYLVQERQIIPDEADIILLMIYESSRMTPEKSKNMQPPRNLAERPFWISFAYTNITRHFEQAMTFCGLNRFIPYAYFDGYLFHKMYSRFLVMDLEERKKIIEPILDYRLYTR